MLETIDRIKDSKKSRKFYLVSLTAFFGLGYFLFGPAIHEVSHTILGWVLNCRQIFTPGLNIYTGFRGTLEIECTMNQYLLSLIYLSGYLGTLTASLIVLRISSIYSSVNEKYISSFGLGMLVSIVSSITLRGDIANGLEVLGLERYIGLVQMMLILFILIVALLEVERHFESGLFQG